MAFRDTRLYASLFSVLGTEPEWHEVYRALTAIEGHLSLGWSGDRNDLNGSLVWSNTTQGREYWESLHYKWCELRRHQRPLKKEPTKYAQVFE